MPLVLHAIVGGRITVRSENTPMSSTVDMDTLLGAVPGPGLRLHIIASGAAVLVAVATLMSGLVRTRIAGTRRRAGT
jgi:hypothetical protein